jgi:hypothetical protein
MRLLQRGALVIALAVIVFALAYGITYGVLTLHPDWAR